MLMIFSENRRLLLWLCLLAGVQTASIQHKDSSKFSMSSIVEAAIHPLIAAGSNRCEAFKSFFGITYEQMQEKNITTFHDALNIDHITKNGNIKYNITAHKQLSRYLGNTRDMVVLVHGFLESSEGVMVQGLAPSLLNISGLVVLALDGRKVINLEYFRSSTYARFMGEKLGAFLSEIIKEGQDPAKITLIGHSLGAHISGIAGKRVQQLTGLKLGRITGLDPAGPCFSNTSGAGRLGPGDADYVDAVHTSGGVLGLLEPVGQKDFYPGGGMNQPGCILSTCDHSRAWQLFAESITAPTHFPGYTSESVQANCTSLSHPPLSTISLHPYIVDIPLSRTNRYASRFLMRMAKEWNSLSAKVFPDYYVLGIVKSRENRLDSKYVPARRCGNWTMFRNGLCAKNEVSFMGVNSKDGPPGTYFLSTGSTFPYGLGPAGSG